MTNPNELTRDDMERVEDLQATVRNLSFSKATREAALAELRVLEGLYDLTPMFPNGYNHT
jgi:hypothetical protein